MTLKRITTFEVANGKRDPKSGAWTPCAPFVVERVWSVDRVSGRCNEIMRNGDVMQGWAADLALSESEARKGRHPSALEAVAAYHDHWKRMHDEATRRLNEADGLLDQVRRKGR